jgi:hypothetical protein
MACSLSSCLPDGHCCAVGHEGSVDDVGEAALEGTQRFGLGVTGGYPSVEVGLAPRRLFGGGRRPVSRPRSCERGHSLAGSRSPWSSASSPPGRPPC